MKGSYFSFVVFLGSKLFLAIAALAIIAIGVGIGKGIARQRQIDREVSTLQAEIDAFRAKRGELDRMIQYAGTAEYQEREARLRLGLKKPGEEVLVVPGDPSSEGGVSQPDTESVIPNWKQWARYFFHLN